MVRSFHITLSTRTTSIVLSVGEVFNVCCRLDLLECRGVAVRFEVLSFEPLAYDLHTSQHGSGACVSYPNLDNDSRLEVSTYLVVKSSEYNHCYGTFALIASCHMSSCWVEPCYDLVFSNTVHRCDRSSHSKVVFACSSRASDR